MFVMPSCYNAGDTIPFPFDTFDSDGGSVTITGLAITDVEPLRASDEVARSSDNGYTLMDTDGIDLDGRAGIHGFKINTNDNSHDGFWSDGETYFIFVDAITVDGQTVRFTYLLPLGLSLKPTTAGRTLDVAATGEAGVDLGNVTGTLGQANVGWVDANSRIDLGRWLGTAVPAPTVAGVPRVEVVAALAAFFQDCFTVDSGEVSGAEVSGSLILEIVKVAWDRVLQGNTHNISKSAGRRLRQVEAAAVHASGQIATVTNGHTITLDAGAVATADYYVGDRLDIIEGVGVGQSRLITAYTSDKVCILDSNFTTSPNTSSLYDVVAADVHVSLSDADLAGGFVAVYTNTTTITLDSAAVATADYYKDMVVVFTHGTGAGQSRQITAYTSGRVCTLSPALTVVLDTTTGWHITANAGTESLATEAKQDTMKSTVDNIESGVSIIIQDTNELQIDWTNGGRLDLILDIIAADTTTHIPALIAALNDIAATDVVSNGAITTLSGAVVNVDLVDVLTTYTSNTPQTGDSYARLGAPAGASVSADVAATKGDTSAILLDTGTDGVVLTVSERNAVADALLTRNVSNVEGAAGDHSLCYVVLVMSESDTTTNANKLTVFKTDGTTEFVQKTVTTDATADPLTKVE